MRHLQLLAALALIGSSSALAQAPRQGQYLFDADFVAAAAGSETSAVLMLDGKQDLLVATSDVCALDWGAPVAIDDEPFAATKSINETSIQVVGSYVFAAWLDSRDGNPNLWFNHSLDGGATWIGAQRIDDGTSAGASIVRRFRMEVTPGPLVPNVFFLVGLKPATLTLDELRLVANDGTSVNSFLSPVVVPAIGPQVANPTGLDICAEGNTVHVAWEDNRQGRDEVWYQRSTDRGQSWMGTDLQVTALNDQSGEPDAPVRIDCDGNTIGIAWQERAPITEPTEIRAAVSSDGGNSFSSDLRVGQYNATTVAATNPEVAVYGCGNVSVLWQDGRTGSESIYASTSIDSGASWGADTLLSPAGGSAPQVCSAGDVAAACWVSGNAKGEGGYSLDCGLTWTPLAVSTSSTDVFETACALNPNAGNFGTSPNVVQAWVRDDDTGTDGIVGGYSPCGPATITNRNAGINPQSYAAQPAIMGGSFDSTVDLSTTNHPTAFLVAYEEPLNFPLQSGYVVLVNIASLRGEILGSPLMPGPLASFSFPIPNDPCLCEFDYYSQAVHVGGGMPFALSNAQDGVINAF